MNSNKTDRAYLCAAETRPKPVVRALLWLLLGQETTWPLLIFDFSPLTPMNHEAKNGVSTTRKKEGLNSVE